MIKIGFDAVGIFDVKRSRTIWEVYGTVIFNGPAVIGHGSKISVGEKGILTIGSNFTVTAESSIVCFENITFGNDCLLSWEILLIDTDFHKIINNKGEIINNNRKIVIGNKNWIGCKSLILKGTVTYDNCIVGAGSLLNKNYAFSNVLIAGNPAKIIKEIEGWQK